MKISECVAYLVENGCFIKKFLFFFINLNLDSKIEIFHIQFGAWEKMFGAKKTLTVSQSMMIQWQKSDCELCSAKKNDFIREKKNDNNLWLILLILCEKCELGAICNFLKKYCFSYVCALVRLTKIKRNGQKNLWRFQKNTLRTLNQNKNKFESGDRGKKLLKWIFFAFWFDLILVQDFHDEKFHLNKNTDLNNN